MHMKIYLFKKYPAVSYADMVCSDWT